MKVMNVQFFLNLSLFKTQVNIFPLKRTLADIKTEQVESGRGDGEVNLCFVISSQKGMRILFGAIYENSESVFQPEDTLIGPKWS